MAKLGIMEGRLLPPEPGRFQAFPRAKWADEFELARKIPLAYIELIYDAYGADVNPLTSDLERLRAVVANTGVSVRSVCADYFMEYPFVRCSMRDSVQRRKTLAMLVALASQIGADRVILPFVDGSEIATRQDVDSVVEVLEEAVVNARITGVELHLETSLDPDDFRALLDRLPDPMIKVNYDTGNSASLGYSASEEFAAYGGRIGSVHIKDRKIHSCSVPLGTGDTDFVAVFAGLREMQYRGDFTLQVARGEDGDEIAWAQQARAFVAGHWPIE